MGFARDLQRWQRILLAAIATMVAITTFVAWRFVTQLRAANHSVGYAHAGRVIDADGLEIAMLARSAYARGFLLTGDRLFLEHRLAESKDLQARLAGLSSRGVEVDDIVATVKRLDEATDRAIEAFKTSPEQARDIWENFAYPVQDRLAAQIDVLVAAERAAFTGARDNADDAWHSVTTLLGALLGTFGLLVVLLVYGFARLTRTLLAKQVAEQEQATFRLLDQMPVGIFVLTPEGVPHYANRHATKLLGNGIVRAPLDRLAETYQTYEAGTDRIYPTDRLPVVRALAGEVTECTDMEIRRGDDVVPLHVVGAPVHDSRGELLYAVAGFQDVRELQRVAMRDALTGLANRAAITQIYAREHAVSVRAKRPLAIALIDLDKFKSINDTHGHASGDEVLKRAAAAIAGSLRRSDVVGRWGGEEIVVLLPNTELDGARRAIEKALADVRALEFLGKGSFHVTFSAGVVVAQEAETLDAAVARADVLLYAAKDAGRNRVNAG